MAFKVLFIAYSPDADPERYPCVIETPGCYNLFAGG